MTSSSFFPCSHPASYQTKLRQLQEYDDPPLDLTSSLNDSFGWDDVNGTDVDEEFERLYEEPQPPLSQPSSQPSQTYSQPRNEQRIHRTSFNYRQDHRYRHRYEEETQLSSSVGLNPYSVGESEWRDVDEAMMYLIYCWHDECCCEIVGLDGTCR